MMIHEMCLMILLITILIRVVCRQLGYEGTGVAFSLAHFGPGDGPIISLNCEGHESSLSDCKPLRLESEECGHWEDAGVTCASGKHCVFFT